MKHEKFLVLRASDLDGYSQNNIHDEANAWCQTPSKSHRWINQWKAQLRTMRL